MGFPIEVLVYATITFFLSIVAIAGAAHANRRLLGIYAWGLFGCIVLLLGFSAFMFVLSKVSTAQTSKHHNDYELNGYPSRLRAYAVDGDRWISVKKCMQQLLATAGSNYTLIAVPMHTGNRISSLLVVICLASFLSPTHAFVGFIKKAFNGAVDCHRQFRSSDKCLGGVARAYAKWDKSYVKLECCETLKELDHRCLPRFLTSLNPSYPGWLKSKCSDPSIWALGCQVWVYDSCTRMATTQRILEQGNNHLALS
ncbi:hypothetical protein RHGRI_030186 [Rhododendron griersonianum]|uniref:Prolamin-like domain-containing protein n=1 Tax=Rhododendron griersonianum TaxID=479676 RepID=A0AAV6IQK4_9ERIC|nr:hypothetical protein RHGRI_030186 [Rhododendron griersonianum]